MRLTDEQIEWQEKVLARTAEVFGVKLIMMLSPRRDVELATARFAAMRVLHENSWSLPKIAAAMRRSDHKTVIHGLKRAEDLMQESVFSMLVGRIKEVGKAPTAPLNHPSYYKRPGPKLKALDAPLIVSEYEDGATLLDLSAKHGASIPVIRRTLVNAGVEIRAKGRAIKVEPDHRVEEFMRMRKNGATLQEIGDSFGITRQRVRQLIVMAGKKEEFVARPDTPEEIAAFEEYKNGGSLGILAHRLGVATSTARKKLIEREIPVRKSNRQKAREAQANAIAEKVVKLYRDGKSPSRIVRECGLPHYTAIYRYLARAGVKPNRKNDQTVET